MTSPNIDAAGLRGRSVWIGPPGAMSPTPPSSRSTIGWAMTESYIDLGGHPATITVATFWVGDSVAFAMLTDAICSVTYDTGFTEAVLSFAEHNGAGTATWALDFDSINNGVLATSAEGWFTP